MGTCSIDVAALVNAANVLLKIADEEKKKSCCGRRRFGAQPLKPTQTFGRQRTIAPEFGVAGFPPEDKNKVFGINIRVDEPRREDYCSRFAFERDHEKFDRLVDAAEACTWENKSNTAPLHRVNAIRQRVDQLPPRGINLVGETHWFDEPDTDDFDEWGDWCW